MQQRSEFLSLSRLSRSVVTQRFCPEETEKFIDQLFVVFCLQIDMYAPALRIPLICYAPATGFVTSFETTFFCRSLQSDKGPPGLHCFEGAQAQNSKPGNFSTPQPCYQGRAGEVLSSGCLCVDFPCRVCNVGC